MERGPSTALVAHWWSHEVTRVVLYIDDVLRRKRVVSDYADFFQVANALNLTITVLDCDQSMVEQTKAQLKDRFRKVPIYLEYTRVTGSTWRREPNQVHLTVSYNNTLPESAKSH